MSRFVLALPADTADWGPVRDSASGCTQTCTLRQEGKVLCVLTVQWPAAVMQVPFPMEAHIDGRHGGPRD
jgi:hypothetical protein